jgi:hypothetical protein
MEPQVDADNDTPSPERYSRWGDMQCLSALNFNGDELCNHAFSARFTSSIKIGK